MLNFCTLSHSVRTTALAVMALVGLQAQVDPRLMGDKGSFRTDFLDLLQRANDIKSKPEILTVFDTSGSMNYLTFHKSFPNNKDYETATVVQGRFYSFRFKLSGGVITPVLVDSSGVETTSLDLSQFGSPFSSSYKLVLSGGKLINPAGDVVTSTHADQVKLADSSFYTDLAGVSTANFKWNDANLGATAAVNWVRAASHVRFTGTYKGKSRTIDVPLPWAVLRMSATNNTGPLQRETIDDPDTATVEKFEYDTNYLGTPDSGYSLLRWSGNSSATVGVSIGLIRTDYLFWCFMGPKGDGVNPYIKDATTVGTDGNPIKPYENGMPTVTRAQALKKAIIKTWFGYKNRVYWAMRGFDDSEAKNSLRPADNTSNAIPIPSGNSTKMSRTWVGMNFGAYGVKPANASNANSYDNGVVAVSKYYFTGGTQLVTAYSQSLSQIIDTTQDTSHIFAKIGTESASECSDTVLIVLTDGVPSDSNDTANPYARTSGGAEVTNPIDGNKAVMADVKYPANTPPTTGTRAVGGGEWFNLPALAGMAAHLGNPARGTVKVDHMQSPSAKTTWKAYPNTGKDIPQWLPFTVVERGKQTFAVPRNILTMTVGMSLGKAFTDSPFNGGTEYSLKDINARTAPKYRLMAAAHYGDPDRSTFNIEKAGTYVETKVNTYTMANGQVAPPTCFFDAADPDELVDNLSLAFEEAESRNARATSTAPVVPYSGLGLGAQVYLASFKAEPKGPIWSGDLFMFPTLAEGSTIKILTPTGAEVTGDLNRSNASWSAGAHLENLPYRNRTAYTRLPNGSGLVRLNPDDPSTGFASVEPHFATKDMSGNTLSKPYTADEKKDIVRFLLGSALDGTGANRDKVLGDIIESSLSVLEYDAASLPAGKLNATLATYLTKAGARFRVIFVGTNTGFLHAFGEASYPETIMIGSRNVSIMRGAVQELWCFMPTDFLAQIQFLRDPTQTHRHLVDGTSYAYHLDLPAGTDRNADGKVNASSDALNLERAVLVFGLGKGGRSYYALNVRDPFDPSFAWTVNPDEAATVAGQATLNANKDPKGLYLGNLASDIQKMGFSTAKPAVGRVLFPHPTNANAHQFRDVCFLGGGLSSPEMEAKFSGNPAMGRLVLALDIYSGRFMASYDLMTLSGAGTDRSVIDCVPSGVVPFEFFLGTGLTQRLYFADYRRGLWSIGSGVVNEEGTLFEKFRRDTSQMDNWKKTGGSTAFLRKVFTAPDKEYFSQLPAPFLVGTYPVPRSTAPMVTPAVTGIALSSGDKHNPTDRFFKADTLPSHRLYVLFDRQDGPKEGLSDTAGIPSNKLLNITSATTAAQVDPTSSSYFLKPTTAGGPTPYFGYTLNFPASYAPSGTIPDVYQFVPKALTEPIVLVGTLFYSYFKPGADYDPCSGGTGDTNSFRICEVFSPKFVDDLSATVNVAPTKSCETGKVFAWNGLATQFVARGTQASTQAGLVNVGSGGTGGSTETTVQIKTATTKQAEQWPRVRTWRSAYDY